MADAVSKLYAEIGFKVNQDGLKQAQQLLKGLAKQMSEINNATKEAAKQYGIFSKDKNRQALADAKLAVENEKAENQRNKRKIERKKFEHKQLMDLAKLEFQVEKYNATEKGKAERQQAREAEKAAKEQQKRLKGLLGGFRTFAVGLRNTFLGLAGVGAGSMMLGVKQSLDRSIPTRNFLMSTGVALPDLQEVMQRMVNTGSGMSQQRVMSDIQAVSQNLSDIALGQGELSPYKLLHVAAQRGDVMAVIKAVEQSVKHLDNAMALNLTRRVGLSDDWLAMWRFGSRLRKDQPQISQEQQEQITEVVKAIEGAKFAFKNLGDFITASISPALRRMADSFGDWLISITNWIDSHPETFEKFMDNLSQLSNMIMLFYGAIKEVVEGLIDLAKYLIQAPKRAWDSSALGKAFRKAGTGGMSKIDPLFEADLMREYGGDKVNSFNTDRRTSSKYQANFHNDDHSSTIVNFNGYNTEEMVDKVSDTIDEKQRKKEIRQGEFYSWSDIAVMAGSSGSANLGGH